MIIKLTFVIVDVSDFKPANVHGNQYYLAGLNAM